jgi:glycosyltransferase involved in cell wall biosynthesis
MTIHHHLDPDAGAPGVTVRLAEQYTRAGHDVEVLSLDDLPRGLPRKARAVAFGAFVAARVRRRVRAGVVDVVDASSGDSALLDRTGAGMRRTLLVARSHGLEHANDRRLRLEVAAGHDRVSWRYPIYHGGYRLREVARAMRRCDVNLVLNEADRRLAVDELRVDPGRVAVVPNGVPGSLVRWDPPTAPEVRRIVQLGSYIPRKGIVYAAPALAAVLARYPGVRVAFLGTGCPRDRVLADFPPALHTRIDVLDRYRNADLVDLLRPGDLNLLPTLSEGFGVALLEAMARGLPSVVTDTPGPRQFCRDSANALVVPPADAPALRTALVRLIEDRALRERLSRAAVRTAGEHTWPPVAELNLDVYRRHLTRKREAPGVPAASRGMRGSR